MSNCLNETEENNENYPNSLFDNKKMSRSANNLQQTLSKNGTAPPDPEESVSTSISDWWLDWENDDTDGHSSVSGPSQRRTARTQSRQCTFITGDFDMIFWHY